MPDNNNPTRDPPRNAPQSGDDLVQQVSDKVYAMLLQDLTIELERNRPSSIHSLLNHGGW